LSLIGKLQIIGFSWSTKAAAIYSLEKDN